MELDKDKIIEALNKSIEDSKQRITEYQNILNNLYTYYYTLNIKVSDVNRYLTSSDCQALQTRKGNYVVLSGWIIRNGERIAMYSRYVKKDYNSTSWNITPFYITLNNVSETTDVYIYKGIQYLVTITIPEYFPNYVIQSITISDDMDIIKSDNEIGIIVILQKYS